MKQKVLLILKTIFMFVLSVILIACIAMLFLTYGNFGKTSQTEDEKPIKFLVLGDSIAEGLAGPSPLVERDYYCYCSVIGMINGYDYHNRAVSGHMTSNLLNYISGGDTNAYTHISLIKSADVIDISILGNDLLLTYRDGLALDAIKNDYTYTESILANSIKNIEAIVDRIYELNPDVTLIIQTVYNPIYKDSPIFSKPVFDAIEEAGLDPYVVTGTVINRLNDVLYNYLLDHPYKFYIADVNAQFNYMYQKYGYENFNRIIMNDGIHPSNEGHANILVSIQTLLEKLGYADHATALANYKTLRCDQLDRLFTDTEVNISEAKKAIKASASYDEVNTAYFDAVLNVTPQYRK